MVQRYRVSGRYDDGPCDHGEWVKYSDHDDEIKQLRHELRVKDAEIEDVRGNNFNLQDEIKRLRAELAETRETVTKWMKNLGEAERERDELKRKLAVFEDGIPPKKMRAMMINYLEHKSLIVDRQHWIEWLRRIADVVNDE